MEAKTMVWLANAGQAMAGVFALSAYIPQMVKLYRNKSTGTMAISSWCIWLVSSALAALYAIMQWSFYGIGLTLVYTASMALTFQAITFGMLLYYRGYSPTTKSVVREGLLNGSNEKWRP